MQRDRVIHSAENIHNTLLFFLNIQLQELGLIISGLYTMLINSRSQTSMHTSHCIKVN